jgi:hypothetical protein
MIYDNSFESIFIILNFEENNDTSRHKTSEALTSNCEKQ